MPPLRRAPTEPSSSPEAPPRDRYDEALWTLLIEFGMRWVLRKPWLLGAHRLVMAGVLVVGGYEPARVRVLFALWGAMLVLDLVEARTLRPGPGADRRVAISTGVGMLGAAVTCAVSGGLLSPIVPALIGAVVIPAAAFGHRPATYALLLEMAVLVIALGLLPAGVVGPPLEGSAFAFGLGFSLIFSAAVSVAHLVALTEVYAGAAVLAARMRDEALALHDARARTFESVGARVAHEIKNPLGAIGGLVQLLRRGEHDPKTQERLGVIESEVGRIDRVVRDYLAFSRPLEVVAPVPTALDAIVDDVIALLDARAEKRGVTLVREGEGRAVADPHRLKEALLNVVDNAVEASARGSVVRVSVSVGEGAASLRVSDSGGGMSADVLARIGTPYFTTKSDGTGLGIVLARAVVAQHGGALDIESAPGRGTTVTMRWPEDAVASERARSEPDAVVACCPPRAILGEGGA